MPAAFLEQLSSVMQLKDKGKPLAVCPVVFYSAAMMAFTCQPNKTSYLHVSAADIMSCCFAL